MFLREVLKLKETQWLRASEASFLCKNDTKKITLLLAGGVILLILLENEYQSWFVYPEVYPDLWS